MVACTNERMETWKVAQFRPSALRVVVACITARIKRKNGWTTGACPTGAAVMFMAVFKQRPWAAREIPLEPPRVPPARGLPADWAEPVQIHDDRNVFQAAPAELPVIDIRSV